MESQPSITTTEFPEQPSAAPPAPRFRCSHKARSGKPCRYFALPGSRFCKNHAPRERLEVEALAADLMESAGDFSSPDNVRSVMAKVFGAMLRRQLTSKQAGVLCFIAQTILHSQRAMQLYLQMENKLAPERPIIIDIPSAAAQRALERQRQAAEEASEKSTWNLPR